MARKATMFESWLAQQKLPTEGDGFSLQKIEALVRAAWNEAVAESAAIAMYHMEPYPYSLRGAKDSITDKIIDLTSD